MLAYIVHNPAGELVLQAPESCRYSRQVELVLDGRIHHPAAWPENYKKGADGKC